MKERLAAMPLEPHSAVEPRRHRQEPPLLDREVAEELTALGYIR